MKKKFLKQRLLNEFLETLSLFGELHAPTVSPDGVTAFAPLDAPPALRLDYRRTLIPPKKYLLPFRETILHYDDGGYRPTPTNAPQIVLFGVHPCDLAGIAYLDRVFLGDRRDPSYASRRARLTLVGISCEPDDYCFCPGPWESAPCDLYLSRRKDGFLLLPHGTKGEAMVQAARELLTPSRDADAPATVSGTIAPQDPALRFSDNPLWESFAEACLSCGACSVCCPTCYCFDLREYPDLSGGGTRIREWDNCLFATHGEVSGANFRPGRLERLRYRFLHKFCGFSPLEGVSSCVGCGRCREACPVDIDLRELIGGGEPQSRRVP